MMRFKAVPVAFVLLASGGLILHWLASSEQVTVGPKATATEVVATQEKQSAEVERARKEVKMLDTLYKNAVVSITSRYVKQQDDQPAAMVAKDVFAAMELGGFHRARLVDASGHPQNKENVAKSEFEKLAVAAMKEGKSYYDRVVEKDGKQILQAATIVPAVMKQCADCHGTKEGMLLGTIVYERKIE